MFRIKEGLRLNFWLGACWLRHVRCHACACLAFFSCDFIKLRTKERKCRFQAAEHTYTPTHHHCTHLHYCGWTQIDTIPTTRTEARPVCVYIDERDRKTTLTHLEKGASHTRYSFHDVLFLHNTSRQRLMHVTSGQRKVSFFVQRWSQGSLYTRNILQYVVLSRY